MRILPFFCLLLGCCLAAPSDPKPERVDNVEIVITDQFLKNDYVVYTAEHDIVNIFAPYNQFPFKKYNLWSRVDAWDFTGNDISEESCAKYTVFFVEADINNDVKTYKGLYVRKNDQVTKLLDNGRDAVANNEGVVYFGASDGIYKYNEAANTAEKHGAVTDNIIQLAFYNGTDTIYYLTANHELYKLNTEATSSVKVSAVKDVQAIVFGFEGKMYYYDSKKDVYVFDELDNIEPVKMTGVPASANKIMLISPFIGVEQGALLLVDKIVYLVQPDGGAGITRISLDSEMTAYEPKPALIQYLAKDKKLYELDVGVVFKSNLDKLPGGLKPFVDKFPRFTDCNKTSV